MTRYADDIDDPGRVSRAAGRRHARRDPERAGHPPAPRRRDREVRARHVLLQRRRGVGVGGRARVLVPSPRDVASYDLKPEMSAAGVAEAVVARAAGRLRLLRRQLREPGHGRSHGCDPGRRPRRRGRRRRPRAGRRGDDCAGGVCLVTADHGNAEQMLEADGVSPHTAHTTNPVPLDRHGCRRRAARRRRASPTSLRPSSSCSGARPGGDDGRSSSSLRTTTIGDISVSRKLLVCKPRTAVCSPRIGARTA